MECYNPLNFQSLFQLGIALNLGFSYLGDSCNLVKNKYEKKLVSTVALVEDLQENKRKSAQKKLRSIKYDKIFADKAIERLQRTMSLIMLLSSLLNLLLLINFSFITEGHCEPGISMFILSCTTYLPVILSSAVMYKYTSYKYRRIHIMLEEIKPMLGNRL